MALLDKIIGAESGGRANATNPKSSAGGLGQFLDGTWMAMLQKYRPDLLEGRSRAEALKLKFDPAISREMTDLYAKENGDYLRGRGIEPTDANTYAAHFLGPAGAAKVLSSQDATPVSSLLRRDVIDANPFLANMNVGDFRNWTAKKMNMPASTGAATATAQAAPAAAAANPGLLDPLLNSATASATPAAANTGAVAERSLSQAYDQGGVVGAGLQAVTGSQGGGNEAAEMIATAMGLPPGVGSTVASFMGGGGSGGGEADPTNDYMKASNAAMGEAMKADASGAGEAMTASAQAIQGAEGLGKQMLSSILSQGNPNVDLTRLAQLLQGRKGLGSA